MTPKRLHLVLMMVTVVILGCGEKRASNVVDKPQQEVKIPFDIGQFPFVRKNMAMDSLPSTIDVRYGFIACPCAQWFIKGDTATNKEYFYLERANNKLKDAEDILDGTNFVTLRLKGKFYKSKGYPIGYNPTKGSPDSARVFRYTYLHIVKMDSLSSK